MGPSRHRPRLDYNDPAVPFHGSRYRGIYSVCEAYISLGRHILYVLLYCHIAHLYVVMFQMIMELAVVSTRMIIMVLM